MRLSKYFHEADKHIELIEEALNFLQEKLPIDRYSMLTNTEKFALNALVFRFSKLQDLLESKIFRRYLEFSGYDTSEKSFYDILKEIEKEGIIDIDSWDELRKYRNQIAHEYPEAEEEAIENITLFIEKSAQLIEVTRKLQERYHEIERQRARDN